MQVAMSFMQLICLMMQLTMSTVAEAFLQHYTVENVIEKGETQTMEEIIKVRHLKKYFNEIKAVDDISFSVQRGELFGYLGENGAGKTTTIHMLCTLLKPTDGEVMIDGFRLGTEDEKIKRKIGVVYQNNCLDDILTVKQNLLSRGSLYENSAGELKKHIDYICEILDLKELMNRRFGKLSGGQKRRCEIARALLHTPSILFLDEPTTGLDPASRKIVWETIHRLQTEMKMTVFLTTHYMEEAAEAGHIGIMKKGRLIEYGTPFALKETFAKDKLTLIPKAGRTEEVALVLKQAGWEFEICQQDMKVFVPSTVFAIPILEKVKEMIDGFEVIQGTMDDVFLNAMRGGRSDD